MANDKETYPVMPLGQWWKLRTKLKQNVPTLINNSYLSAILGMKENSVASTIMPGLRATGLVDGDGKLTDRAHEWRADDTYHKVCGEILAEVYPEELRHAIPEPNGNRKALMDWFVKKAKCGESVAAKMAGFYQLLCEADVSKGMENGKSSHQLPKKQPHASANLSSKITPEASKQTDPEHRGENDSNRQNRFSPSLNINVQIHISADSKPDQIDHIFASMAKHLNIQSTSIDD